MSFSDMKYSDNSSTLEARVRANPPAHLKGLHGALERYCADSDGENLFRAYSVFESKKKTPRNHKSALINIKRGFGSFTFSPSRSYKLHKKHAKKTADLSAIKSDWKMVGEYLSYALITQILKDKIDEKRK